MLCSRRLPLFCAILALVSILVALSGCASEPGGGSSAESPKPTGVRPPLRPATPSPPPAPVGPASAKAASATAARMEYSPPVMLGIDVLAAQNFAPLAGKRVALLTHPAGVNRFGLSTVEVLRRAPNVQLVALFGSEHGIYGTIPAGKHFQDHRDPRTGLPVMSLYNGVTRKPSKTQLKGIDVLVIDLQDIGVRSYTFGTWMRYAMEGCFENGIEVMVLDRPNPLGGVKVDGPPLERQFWSGFGGFDVPYVHGLTMGELARLAAGTPNGLEVPESVRLKGKLTVIPMRGWRRAMRWPETGLTFVPTSPYVRDFAACVGYAMTGLGCEIGGFTHGLGTQYPFRGLFYEGKTSELLIKELEALRLPGLSYHKIAVTNAKGEPATGVLIAVNDWDDWRPTELSFHLMRLACKFNGKNVFAALSPADVLRFNKLVGSAEWTAALRRDGTRVNVAAFIGEWQRRNAAYQQQTRRFWLYD
jgi:uncharacterized protein YbbC (DUF1343 family)